MNKIVLCVFTILLLSTVTFAKDQLVYSRTHLVDVVKVGTTNNYFFRFPNEKFILLLTVFESTQRMKFMIKTLNHEANIPIDDDKFAYKLFTEFAQSRAKEHGISIPDNFYLVDISLMNTFDENKIERAFWEDPANAHLGKYINWPMGLAGLYDPRDYNDTQIHTMSNSTVWEFDMLPARTSELIRLVHSPGPIDVTTGRPRPVVFFTHCQAGADRTGQMVIAYRLGSTPLSQYTPNTLQQYFQLNVEECGRSPNDWSVKATEWFCLFLGHHYDVNMGNCLHIADCKRFDSCTWPPV